MEPGSSSVEETRTWEHRLLGFLLAAFILSAGATLAASHPRSAVHPAQKVVAAVAAFASTPAGLIPVQVTDVVMPEGTTHGVVLLVDTASEYVLPIFLKATEGAMIRDGLRSANGASAADLLGRTVAALGGELRRVELGQGKDGPVETHVIVRLDGRDVRLDAQPADALALAVATKAPVFATPGMLLAQGIRRETVDHLPGGLPSRLKDPEDM
jgi:bifunctional DNase/RNase